MSKTNTWENDLLKLVFQNTSASLIGDATGLVGSGVAGSLYVSLHTADPGEAGDQTTSETAPNDADGSASVNEASAAGSRLVLPRRRRYRGPRFASEARR